MTNGSAYDFVLAETPEQFAAGAQLFREYAYHLNFDLGFQNFDQELGEIRMQYGLPMGALVLIRRENVYVGCGGLREFDGTIGELKRMYIRAESRGLGLGKMLLERLVALAAQRGYERVRLDTMPDMTTAAELYRKLGFYPIEPYRFNPDRNALFFEKKI